MRKLIKVCWLAYYKVLWCTRCYVWNPFILRVKHGGDWLFDQADLQVRKRVSRWID